MSFIPSQKTHGDPSPRWGSFTEGIPVRGKAAVANLFTEDSLSPIVPTFLLHKDKSSLNCPFGFCHRTLNTLVDSVEEREVYVLLIGLNGKS